MSQFFQVYSILIGLIFLVFALKTLRFARAIFPLKHIRVRDGYWPRVSFVVPACNEADTIETAVESLLKMDYPNLEVVLVNDRSSDNTGAIIDAIAKADPRVVPVHIKELPEGWLGKVHALERGIELTSGDWILLADADVHFAPQALRKALSHCMRERIDFLTAIPDVQTKSLSLMVMMAQLFHQASLFFNPNRINHRSHKACYGQGAFMLFKRAVYNQSEKMEWLKMEVIDDTGLALLMRRAGAKMGVVSGRDEIALIWYPDLSTFIRGIEKNAFAFSQYSLTILLGFTAVVLSVAAGFLVTPWLSDSTPTMIFSAACMGLYLASIRYQLKQLLQVDTAAILLLPLAMAVLPLILLRNSLLTLFRGGISWRGTFYSLAELRANQRMKLANLVFAAPEPDEDEEMEAASEPA